MDELEKKRQQLADPAHNILSMDSQAFARLSPEQQAEFKHQQAFERQLKSAFEIGVDPTLADKVILNQRTQNRQNSWLRYSVAAAIASLSLALLVFINRPALPQNEEALAHVYDEAKYLQISTIIAPEEVNAKLAAMNLSLPQLPVEITFAYGCRFGNGRAMHLIANVAGSKVTLFITGEPLQNPQSFGDKKLVGQSRNIAAQGVIAIAENTAAIELIFAQVVPAKT